MIKFLPGQWFGLKDISAEEYAKLRPLAEKAVVRGGVLMVSAIKRKLTGARSGRIYRRKGRTHQASAPGEPPASWSGRLRLSINAAPPIWTGDNVGVNVGTDVAYGPRLEYGGTDYRGVRLLARPFMAPAFLENEDRLQTIFEEAFK